MERKVLRKQKATERKAYLIGLKGGKCACCRKTPTIINGIALFGDFEFHHRDNINIEKCFNISQGMEYSENKLYEELDKTDLLCNRCHSLLHSLYGERVSESDTKKFYKLYNESL